MIDNKTLANAYVACGSANGFAIAEILLSRYLPRTKPDGKCFNVPPRKRAEFMADLKNATEHGVEFKEGGGLVVLKGATNDT